MNNEVEVGQRFKLLTISQARRSCHPTPDFVPCGRVRMRAVVWEAYIVPDRPVVLGPRFEETALR
eukprot:6886326-Pyramimonas_sp.AAC.1